MTTQIVDTYQKYFDPIVKQSYQGMMELKKAVRVRDNVEGSTADFRVFGKGTAKPRGALSSDVPVMGNDYTIKTATLSDWVAADYTDIFSKAKVNFDEIRLQAESNGFSVGRQCDQQVIDAMVASNNGTSISVDIGGTGTNMNFAKIRKASALMNKNNVPNDGNRWFVIHANGLEAMLAEPELTSADYNSLRALQSGELKGTYMGFNWIVLGDRDEGGLPLATGVRSNFAFHGGQRGSVGLAVGMNFKSSIDWVAHKKSWLVSTDYSGGSVTIDTNGVYKVLSTDAGVAVPAA